MATKKKVAPKKATPAKKVATPKKTVKPAPKKVVVKAAPKKAAPAKKAAAPKKTVKPAPKKVVVKAAPKKAAPAKKAAAPKKLVKAAPKKAVPAPKKAVVKAAPKKAAKKQAKVSKKVVVPKLSTKRAVKYQPDFTKSVLDSPKIEKAKSVIRYSDVELQEFKDIILRKLDAAKKELAYLQGLITRRDEGGDLDEGRYMTMEDGSVSMEREQLSQLASRQITFIDHLEKALMRVENKTYGICRVTGKLIEKARLRAVPHATLSMEAKSSMNK
ncbi:MAG: TraR/DksA family transcriptional regulator [Niabella sp.]